MKTYVNIYELDRRYGGPEEGGWWYNTGTVVKSETFDNEEAAQERSNELFMEGDYPTQQSGNSKTDIYSVNYPGHGVFEIMVEEEPGQSWPVEIPHYE